MHRIDTPTAQRDKFGQGKNGFTRGNPQTGTPATQLDYLYCDAMQEEIANAIESAGIKLDKSKHDQLATAIKEFVKKGSVQLNSSINSTSETEAATPRAVKSVNDRVNAISDNFLSDDFESRVRSPDRRFHLSVKNDGTVSMYSHLKNDFSWHINHDGYINGYVAADKIYGLDEFVRNRVLPVGIPQPWPSDHLPAGWLECNGSPFDVNQFPKLGAVYPWGTLPDLRGLFIRGKDNGRGLDPNRGILSYQDDAIRNIWGEISPISESFAANPTSTGAFRAFEKQSNNTPAYIDASSAGGVTFDASRVVPVSHDNHPRNLAFIYIVKAE